MLLSFDDTDSPTGGCTTHALFAVLASLDNLAPKGLPRLVRLNPNVPWKTRGNGAVAVELVRPTGRYSRIGEWRGMELRAYPDGEPVAADEADIEPIWAALQAVAQADASPALLLADKVPPEFYWHAVRELFRPAAAAKAAGALENAQHRVAGDGRALAGCLGAAAWDGTRTTAELIAFREPSQWGNPRQVSAGPLVPLDLHATFHTYDHENKVLCCVPNTPCPVLLGLRGQDAGRLHDAAIPAIADAAGEQVDGWLLWDTNQASGDHVVPVETILDSPVLGTIEVAAVVAEPPLNKQGGHVHVSLDDLHGLPFEIIAFEPSGKLREGARALLPGDEVVVTGAFAEGVMRLESLRVRHAAPAKVANPVHCGKSMKSQGANAGYKCACGATAPIEAAEFEPRPAGQFEPDVMARRHLHRPLSW